MECNNAATHYDADYFAFQKEMGVFGGWAETFKFAPYVASGATVIDFGCGGGFLLKNLECARRLGVEINDTARELAVRENGIAAVKYADQLEDGVADLVISNHALEHCIDPHRELSCLLTKVKPGGRLVVFVPHESLRNGWFAGDVNNHLYSWNPMTLGNLATSAGWEVESVEAFYHVWPPMYQKFAALGFPVFNLCCRLYGLLDRRYSQVKVVARRRPY